MENTNKTKTCAICSISKDLEEFNKFSKSPDGRQSYCRQCARVNIKQWRKNNEHHRKQYEKKYQSEHKEFYYQQGVKYREQNKEKILQGRREYAEANPERHMVYDANKRAKKRNVPITITYKDIVIPEVCPVLGIKLERNTTSGPKNSSPTLDSIIPDKGYVPGNIAVISHRANRIKTDASLEEIKLLVNWLEKVISG